MGKWGGATGGAFEAKAHPQWRRWDDRRGNFLKQKKKKTDHQQYNQKTTMEENTGREKRNSKTNTCPMGGRKGGREHQKTFRGHFKLAV